MDNERYTVVGVLPEAFKFLNPDLRVFVPLAFTDAERGEDRRWSQNHEEIGRLAAGATPAQAQARIDALNANVVERAGPLKSALVNAGYHTRVVSLRGRSGAQRARRAPDVMGRRHLSAAHRRREHYESLIGASERATEGTRHASRAWRGQGPRHPSAGHRNDCPDGPRRAAGSRPWLLEPRRADCAGARRHSARARNPHGRDRRRVHPRPGVRARRRRRRWSRPCTSRA